MNLLFRVLYAQKCSSTHHKLAMDALRYLKCDASEDWARLFLSEIQLYTDGAKAPDKKFKDFRNHVLHVSDNFWGGAVTASETWYARLVDRLKHRDWARSVYCAGVLSHYVTDPLMPLHTGQTEDEGQVHKFIEWGTAKIYADLVNTHEAARALQNWKPPENVASDDWLALLIIEGAQLSHQHYDIMIDHYDAAIGTRNPAAGFDHTSRSSLAMLLATSIRMTAFVIERAIADAEATPPRRSLTVSTALSGLSTPLFWITRKLKDNKDRKAVEAIWKELQQTGKVIKTLPEDDRAIRAIHAEEVLGITVEQLNQLPVRPAGSKYGSTSDASTTVPNAAEPSRPAAVEQTNRKPRFYLELDSPVVDAPSIGPKTARRLKTINIKTVDELLDADATESADQLDQRWISTELFQSWQLQSTLMCRVPGLRGHDAQLLVEVDITRPEQLQEVDAETLHELLAELSTTDAGERILRGSQPPDLAEINRWIDFADQSRALRAA